MLDSHIDKTKQDLAVNTPDDLPGYHPHITLPYLKFLLERDFGETENLTYFTVTRHPLTMLWSYYKYFQPDTFSRYNYQKNWHHDDLMDFEKWLEYGRVGMNPNWLELAPSFVSTKDLSPLSLEAHINNRDNLNNSNCKVIKLEDLESHIHIYSCLLGLPSVLRPLHANRSQEAEIPQVPEQSLQRIRKMFPMESTMYAI